MIKRSHIRQFLALVEAESFTLGASRIHVTQPTLSAGIADLERILGTKLFLRSKRRVKLSDAGQRFLAIAREIDQNFKKADRFSGIVPEQWPDIRLGLLKTLSSAMVEELVRPLSSRFSIEITEGSDAELRSMANKGRLDAIVTIKRETDDENRMISIIREPYRMFVSDDHPLAGRTEVDPENLAGEIMIARRSCEILRETSQFFTRHGVRPKFAMRSENDDWCMKLVAVGVGITTAPLSLQVLKTTPISVRGYDFNRSIAMIFSAHFNETQISKEMAAVAMPG
ncbi:LysR family transcriptional regulator [Altererythrobacter sp. FM1]|uniref:LysR family transcriptional regulator n=1 Tax=Tsuneonella flava TaxID=2055955 RepID=UPI000C7FB4FD|nr:LysR family transcriptional regulator [Tsuneonella flava]ROT97347.1 LysR family transcriptional regulator [Altererythrobacter sp. FM1]